MTWISMVTIVFPSEYQWYRDDDDYDGHYQKTMLCCRYCYCCGHVQLRVMVEVVVVVMMMMILLLVHHDCLVLMMTIVVAVVVVASVVVVLFGVRPVLVSSFSCMLIG